MFDSGGGVTRGKVIDWRVQTEDITYLFFDEDDERERERRVAG